MGPVVKDQELNLFSKKRRKNIGKKLRNRRTKAFATIWKNKVSGFHRLFYDSLRSDKQSNSREHCYHCWVYLFKVNLNSSQYLRIFLPIKAAYAFCLQLAFDNICQVVAFSVLQHFLPPVQPCTIVIRKTILLTKLYSCLVFVNDLKW